MATPVKQKRAKARTYTWGLWNLTIEDSDSVAFLLIGSTGHGKSSLGNFLLNPAEEHIIHGNKQTFPTARTSKPETRKVKCVRSMGGRLRIVDTPGLNESADGDLEHMIDVVRTLKRLQYISACILCVRFESKIDAQYKATVTHYRNLLPMLFEGNVVIVAANFQTDPRSERLRKAQGVDVDEVIDRIQREVIESGRLTYHPQVFKIDSLPLDANERRVSEEARKAILDYINDTLIPVQVSDLSVAKTAALLQCDAEEICRLDGEITGYNMRLKQANQQAENVLSQIEEQEKEIAKVKNEVDHLKFDMESKDSEKPIISKQWSLEQGWKLFRTQRREFEVTSLWPIVEYTTWDNGHLVWKEVKQEEYVVRGVVEGAFNRGLYACVILWTTKRNKYAQYIVSLRKQVADKKETAAVLEKHLCEYKDHQQKYSKDIQLLERHINEINEKKARLSDKHMSLDEAASRLQALLNGTRY